jgi:CheY-like chemotaxis protein
MDVRMPVMDGLEATRELRRREGERRTPVVALTAGALRQEQQECFEAGMDDFATKPFTSDSIHGVLTRWLVKAMR